MARRSVARSWWAVATAAAVLVFVCPLALPVPLLDPAEGLHGAIAQEMVERGDWLTPRFLGEPFLDKPILYFWAEAASLRLFGFREWALRLPGLLLGLFGAAVTAAVGWRLCDRLTGIIAGVFYATMFLPAGLAQAAAHDVALVPWIALAILGFVESQQAKTWRQNIAYTAAIGACLGMSCLAKGFVGIALVGVTYGAYLLATRRATLAIVLRGIAALAVAALVAAPWYLAMEWRHPGYLHYFVVERHLLGYATDSQTHGGRPVWYYLPIVLGGGLPWIGYLPATVRHALASRRHKDQRRRDTLVLLVAWFLGCLLLLSLAKSKLVTYIWPIFPPLAILVAWPWARALEGRVGADVVRSLRRGLWQAAWIGPAMAPLLGVGTMVYFGASLGVGHWLAVAVVTLSAVVPLAFLFKHRLQTALQTATVSVAAQFILALGLVLPIVGDSLTARDLAQHFNAAGAAPQRLLVLDERIGSVVFYLDPPLRRGLRAGQWEGVPLGEVARLRSVSPAAAVALPEQSVADAAGSVDLEGMSFRRAGRYRLYEARQWHQRLAEGRRAVQR